MLGCPQIYADTVPLQINRKRVRALLFYLASEQKPVSRSQLSYMFWPDKDYSSASQNLSIYLSYLKNEFNEEIISVVSGQVSLGPDIVTDISTFQCYMASGKREKMLAAVQLFRGSFLEGFSLQHAQPFEQWLMEMVAYWNNQFIDASLQVADILAKSRYYDDALRVLEQAYKADPLRESVCRQRMEILSSMGDRSTVIRVYHDLVSCLSQELGVPPSPETASCYQKIISANESDTPAPGLPERQDQTNPKMVFVGRDELLHSMCGARSGHFVLVQGKSGLGKTSLVRAYIEREKLFSFCVAFKQQEHDIPYFAIIKQLRNLALSDDYTETLTRVSRQLTSDRWNAVCQLVPELGRIHPAAASVSIISTQQIMEATEQFLFYLINKQRAVVFFDDIQYCDPSSLELIRHLVSQPLLNNIQFFSTFRPSLSHPQLVAFLNNLQRENLLQIIELGKLEDASMLELLLHYYPDIDSATSGSLLSLADGNPFWMKTIINGLDSGYAEISGKKSLKNLFNFALLSLSPRATEVLYMLTVLGESCDAALFSAICAEQSPGDESGIYTELSSANFISKDNYGTVRFVHSKIHEYVLSVIEANPTKVSSIHLALANVMKSVYGERASGQQAISIVDHYKLSEQPELCGKYASKAGAFLLSIANLEQAVTYYKLAFSYLDEPEKFDIMLSMYSSMLQLEQNYEANIYIDCSISMAKSAGYREYALVFEALLKLSRYPEYMEVHLGALPCYKISVDDSISEMLLEAKDLIESGKPNSFLFNQLLSILRIYYMIVGDYASAQDYCWRIISLNMTLQQNNDIVSQILLYSAVKDVIALMNWFTDNNTVEVISLQEQIFHSAPFRSFTSSNFGSNALLMNLKGNTAEGTRLMNMAISEARRTGNRVALAECLTTQALLIRKNNPEKSYSMNYEAYQISKEINARYIRAKALTGLVITSSSVPDAEHYLSELREIARQIGNDSLDAKLETAQRALIRKTDPSK